MQEMLKEVQYCQNAIATKFKKTLEVMSDKDEQHFQEASECHIIFATNHILIKIFGLGTIAISQVIIGDQLTKTVISN